MSKKCIVKILDEVNCVLIGLDTKDNEYFKHKYSPLSDGYFFSKKYKLGVWDGRISFYSKGGKTYVKLLDEIIPELRKRGYQLELIDNREPFDLMVPQIDQDYFSDYGIELGRHQVDGVNALTRNNGGIMVAGTGAGKSYVTSALAKLYNESYGFRILVIVPNIDLISQSIETFKEFDLDVGEYSGDTKDINHNIVVSSWQSLQNLEGSAVNGVVGIFKVVIVDECHGTKGSVLRNILNNWGSHFAVRIGVTGTLPTSEVDAMAVKITLGVPQYIVTAKQLIDSGWLAKINISILKLEEDKHAEYDQWKEKFPDESTKFTYKKFLEKMFPDYDSEKRYLNTNKERLDYISNTVNLTRSTDKGNTLVLVNGVNVGKELSAKIEGSYFIYGMDKKEFRKKVYALFKDNDDIVVIATSQLASTGLNIPRIFYLCLVDIGKSYIRVIQSIGRGLRKAYDKDSVEVIDISSNLKYSADHQNKRIAHYKNAEYPFEKHVVKYAKKTGTK